MAHDVQRAAALDAGGCFLIGEVDRHRDLDDRALAEALEVDMNRKILERIELEIARDDAGLLAVDVEIEHGGQEAAGIDAAADFDGIDRDRGSRLVLAIDGARHAAGTAFGAGWAFAGARTNGGFQFFGSGHGSIPRQVFDRTAKIYPSGGAPASRDSASLLGSSGLIPAQIGRRNEAFAS